MYYMMNLPFHKISYVTLAGITLLLIGGCSSNKSLSFVSTTPGAAVNVRGIYNGKGTTDVYGNAHGKDSAVYNGMYATSNTNFAIRQDKKGYRTSIVILPKTHTKRYILPGMVPFPKHTVGQRNLYVEHVNVSIDSNHVLINYYNSLKDFEANKINVSAPERTSLMYKDIDISDGLNEILAENNYYDTTAYKRLSLNDYNWVALNCEVTGLTWNHVDFQACVDLTCKWKFVENMTEKVLYTKTITSRSNWGIYTNGEDKDTLIYDAIKQGLLDILSDPETPKCIVGANEAFTPIYNSWIIQNIAHPQKYSSSIQEAVKAVVTVKTPKGHGSGCLISDDGYIITNSHVVSDTNIFTILFENGDKHIGRLIRSNPLYDLALIKVDSVPIHAKPLQLGTDDNWSIGTDVYAIGTPSDVELSQTLTKGIVSATRVVGDIKYIQSDVSISPGNSGGAMLIKEGLLIGIVNAKVIGRGVQGLGFAIPSDYIEKALKLHFE